MLNLILRTIPGLTLALVVLISPARAQPASCILGAFTLPLLGGSGDAPLLPATMQGKPVALYYSTTVDGLYGGDITPYAGEDTNTRTSLLLDGVKGDDYSIFKPERLKLGDLELGSPGMVRLNAFPARFIGLRPVIGVIGPSFFAKLSVLLDLPHGVFALIRFSDDASCKTARADFLGAGEAAFPLDTQDRARIPLNGIERAVMLDPNRAINTLPRAWAAASASDGSPDRNKPATVQAVLPITGAPGIADTSFHLEDGTESPETDRDISHSGECDRAPPAAGLGLEFFERHVVLFDYPKNTVYFLPSRHRREDAGSALRFPHRLQNLGPNIMTPSFSGWPLTPIYPAMVGRTQPF
ncbi:hypothetical protein C0V97_00725 [Asaia sp. W19]|uniref:hypothetical protein n=1 Tax=unclassified Asaia TaxID=2685023 RepID=UPI000F8DFA16|nr:hypothetical protein [Asaia sp. W19]RUT27628.1 hypothetical protein C0V97_00725 [Asaia sp. W19]